MDDKDLVFLYNQQHGCCWLGDARNQASADLSSTYHQISNMSHQITNFKCVSSCLPVVFAQSIEARYQVGNEDAVGATPTGDAPTTSEWSTILLPTWVSYIRCFMVVLQYSGYSIRKVSWWSPEQNGWHYAVSIFKGISIGNNLIYQSMDLQDEILSQIWHIWLP